MARDLDSNLSSEAEESIWGHSGEQHTLLLRR